MREVRPTLPSLGRLRLLTLAVLLAGLVLAAVAASASAQPATAQITVDELLRGTEPTGLVPNDWFMPSASAGPAKHPFHGTIHLSEAQMGLDPDVSFGIIFGKDPTVFPAVSLGFFTDMGRLVPVTQDVIRVGSLPGGTSYWDVIVQPGRVWSEPGEKRWSRASFPFALVHSIEGETHNGVATFLYNNRRVSHVSFQKVQQTAPYYVYPYFDSWGVTSASVTRNDIRHLGRLRHTWRQELRHRLPTAPWKELEKLVGANALEGFDGYIPADEVIVSGLLYKGVLYRHEASTAAGPYPYTDEMRYGVWSVTKSAGNAIALFRLAQKYGPGILDERIADYVPEAADYPGWEDVTFSDMANMASGHGFGSPVSEPNDMFSGYLDGNYAEWYEAPSKAEKAVFALDQPVFPWAPGTVARYRDQDAYLYGVALDAYLKAHEGRNADLWEMVRDEVYRSIGIFHAPMNRTIEPDGSMGQAMMAYGYYPTLRDLARISQLLQHHGRWNGKQILYRPLVDQVRFGDERRGFSTGTMIADGEELYNFNYYMTPYSPESGGLTYTQAMHGWGANLVLLMPKGIVGMRMAKNWSGDPATGDTTPMAIVGDRLGAFDD
ncbi:MAG TPA: serine hydrolase domain-containing protein [Thermoleophilia bacterium]|nr:serine hydrolase domain-containing protein [Thermoleophilia bacterium]